MSCLRIASFLFAACLLVGGVRAAAPDARALDAVVKQAMDAWNVPGRAVVVVRDDRIVYLAGHGVRARDKKDPVTPRTLFPLGSCSKAFTTAAMAVLVDEEKLHWDDRVSKHLNWFHLSDPLADRDVRLRDLLCHRTGVASHDALWYRAPWKPEETVRRVAKLPLAQPFRTALQYQSTMYTAAGLAAAAADGRTWPELIRKRLLEPLEMKDTRLDSASTLATADVAAGCRPDAVGQAEPMPRCCMDADPAGSIHSSARDLARWLRFHLSEGVAEGKRIVSAAALRETHAPQMVVRMSPAERLLFPDTVQMSYGLGWAVYDYRGLGVLAHGGAIDGFRTQLMLVPDKKLGLAVLSNMHQTPMNLALAHLLVDRLLDLPKRDWHAVHRKGLAFRTAAVREQERLRQARRKYGTTPSRELAAYVEVYEHPAYGAAKIVLNRGALLWRWRDDAARLEHFHHDTFTVRSDLAGNADLTFTLDRAGAVERVAVTGALNVTFRKVVPKKDP